MANSGLPGPCSVRQHMYMFPEEYAKDAEGNPLEIENIDVVLYGGAAGCLPAGAEVLTESGWIFIDHWDGEEILQYCPEKSYASFTKPEEYIKLPCDSFHRIKGEGLDFILSPEHRVLYYDEEGKHYT